MADTFKSFVSFPRLPTGGVLELDLLECGLCGAAVSDTERHEEWHAEQGEP
jgi:hypothetical protein